MRLLKRNSADEIALTEDYDGDNVPQYAILSHTWGAEEVLFKEMLDGTGKSKLGYEKIVFCATQAWRDGLQFCWVDTCCIDKTNNTELQEAINSMFRWYRGAAKCYVYLADVSSHTWETSFRDSKWFARGWTLQELIAPVSVEFFSREGVRLGNKSSLEQDIHAITGIPVNALRGSPPSDFSVSDRLAWMGKRETTRQEDKAYALLGIFEVYMPLIYGEGRENALKRLREEIRKASKGAAEDSAKDDACLADLRDTDPRDDKRRIEQTKGGLLEDSYRWVLGHDDFQQWRRDEHPRLLWIKGSPGKGKTMLLCGIIEALSPLTKLQDNKAGTLLSYFFCQATDARINRASAVVRGLIYLLVRQEPSLIRHVQEPYEHAGKELFQDANAWAALCKILGNILRDPAADCVYLIVDALDECHTDDLPKLLDLIVQHSALPRVKWIVSSRDWLLIERRLREVAAQTMLSLEIRQNTKQVARAVDAYIEASISRVPSMQDDEDLQARVRSVMRQRADGTFLWVSLVIEELRKANSWEVEQIVDEVPEGLTELYSRMVGQIQQLKRGNPELCRLVLLAVITAYRPLSLHELGVLSGLPKRIAGRTKDVEALVKMCRSLLTVQGGAVYVVHQSAKDFLVNEVSGSFLSAEINQVHHDLFVRSLQVLCSELRRDIYGLQHPGFPVGQITRPDPDPLARAAYSCVYWADHLDASKTGPENDGLREGGKIHSFLDNKYLHWLEALGLLGSLSEGVLAISKLNILLETADTQLASLTRDARRFILANRSGIEQAPLQTYTSALVFSPMNSIVRQRYKAEEPSWIVSGPRMEDKWNSCLSTLEGHRMIVYSVAWSRNSALLASASRDSTVKIWDRSTGHCVSTLEGHRDSVNSVSWSHDSALLASASHDKTVKIWDHTTSRYVSTLEGHGNAVYSVAWSHDSALLASASGDKTIKIWDYATSRCILTLEGHHNYVYSVAWSHDSGMLASASVDNTVKIWDRITSRCISTLKGHSDVVYSVAWSHDSTLLASASVDNTVKIWDCVTGSCISTLDDHRDFVYTVTWSHDSALLASASGDKTVKIWDRATSHCVSTLKGHSNIVRSVAWSHNSDLLATGSVDSTLKIWDYTISRYIPTVEGHSSNVNAVAWSHDSALLASASNDTTVKIWDRTTSRCISTLEGHRDAVYLVAWSNDSALLASASIDKTVKIWNRLTSRCISTLEGYRDYIYCVAWSHVSGLLASASVDSTVKIWDRFTGSCISVLKGHSNVVYSVAWSHDSALLASASGDKTVKIWDRGATSRCISTLEGHSGVVYSVAWSHDSTLLASASQDNTIKIWDRATGRCISTFEGHRDSVNSVAWSRDSTLLASASNDKTVKIWDRTTSCCISTLEGHSNAVSSVSWSHDLLASASADKTVKIWDHATSRCVSSLEGHTNIVYSVAWSHDSALLASASYDSTVKIWSRATGNITTLKGHDNGVYSTAWSHDSALLASASHDSSVKIWDYTTGQCVSTLDTGRIIHSLQFDPADSSLLHTDIGTFHLQPIATSTPSPPVTTTATRCSPSPRLRTNSHTGYGLTRDNTWITYGGLNVLWLPPEFRPLCSAISGPAVALGCASGRVLCFLFAEEPVPGKNPPLALHRQLDKPKL